MIKITGTVVGAILLVGMASAPSPAADRPSATPNYATKSLVVFQNVSAPASWKLKATVENYDRRFAALRMKVGVCANYPKAGCVKVYGTNRPRADYWGRWSGLRTWGSDGRIKLNRGYGIHRHVTCHEVGHAIGLEHWNGPSCLNPNNRVKFATRSDMDALRRAYR